MKKTKILHISHNDLDGYGCTIMTELIVGGYPEGMFSLETKHILPNAVIPTLKFYINSLPAYDKIIITDLAVTQYAVDLILGCNNPEKFIWFDHHNTTVNLTGLNNFIVEQSFVDGFGITHQTCATRLYYEFLRNDKVLNIEILQLKSLNNLEHLVDTVTMYDTYAFKDYSNEVGDLEKNWSLAASDAPNLNTLFHNINHEEFTSYLYDYIQGIVPIYSLTTASDVYPWIGKIIQISNENNERYIAGALKKAQILEFSYTVKDGTTICAPFALVYAERNGPGIGNRLLENEAIGFVAVVTNNQVSLYSRKNGLNVYNIAAKFGGGGHPSASGFSIPYRESNKFERIRFESILDAAENLALYSKPKS